MTKPLREAESHGVRCRWNPVEKDVVTVDRADLIALCDSHDALATRCAAAEAEYAIANEASEGAHRNMNVFRQERDAARAQVAALSEVILWALGERDAFPDRPDRVEGKPYPWYWWRTELRRRYTAALPTPTPQPEQDDA